MEVSWKDALDKAAKEIMLKGGKLEFIVYTRDHNKRLPRIHIYPENKIDCREETLID